MTPASQIYDPKASQGGRDGGPREEGDLHQPQRHHHCERHEPRRHRRQLIHGHLQWRNWPRVLLAHTSTCCTLFWLQFARTRLVRMSIAFEPIDEGAHSNGQ